MRGVVFSLRPTHRDADMHTTQQLLDLAKQRLALKHGLTSPMTDYRLAKLLGLRQATVSSWRTGVRGIGTEFAARFAEACELPEAYVFACIELEREKDPTVQRILTTIAEAFRGKAAGWIATALVAGGMSIAPAGNQAHASGSDVTDLYIMRSKLECANRLSFESPCVYSISRRLTLHGN